MRVLVPPIKSQGIKTKLVPWIKSIVPEDFKGTWVEPFMGTGCVAFNVAPHRALLCDKNPHLINFYSAIARNEITPGIAREYLREEGEKLLRIGEDHYYAIRDRFNQQHTPLDFLFINRAGFNGMIRFSKKGNFNIPFCRKPNRFAEAYVTKIVNQIDQVSQILKTKEFTFKCQEFDATISEAIASDFIYCDPPYIERHVDYYGAWDETHEKALADSLSRGSAKFILSTWHHNDFRSNEFIGKIWSGRHIYTREHFYHVGAKEDNRNPMIEALVTNFGATPVDAPGPQSEQISLFG